MQLFQLGWFLPVFLLHLLIFSWFLSCPAPPRHLRYWLQYLSFHRMLFFEVLLLSSFLFFSHLLVLSMPHRMWCLINPYIQLTVWRCFVPYFLHFIGYYSRYGPGSSICQQMEAPIRWMFKRAKVEDSEMTYCREAIWNCYFSWDRFRIAVGRLFSLESRSEDWCQPYRLC